MKKVLSAVIVLLLGLTLDKAQADNPETEECGLSGYDLGALDESEYWVITVPNKENCILPLGYNESEVFACDIYISVCKTLGNTTCPGSPNSTMCQLVVTTDLEEHYYDMGAYKGNSEFTPLTSNRTGFESTRIGGNEIQSKDCNGTINTNLFFLCNPDAVWNGDEKNVSQYIVLAEQFLRASCSYLIELDYSGACYIAPTLSPAHCSIEGYDTGTISSREYWTATVDASACYDASALNCVLYLAFCHPVPVKLGDNCYNAAVCEKGIDQDEISVVLNLGSFTNYTRFYENDESGDSAGFHMRVENGSKPENGTLCKNGMQSEVILVCNQDAPWNSQDISDFVQLAYHHHDDPCMYVIKIAYRGACVDDPGVSGPKASPVGWILIGLFLGAVLGYLLVGSAIGYFVKGERGVRVLPQYNFWKGVVALILEGCKFTWDSITCHKFDGKMSTSRGQPDYDKI